MADTLRGGWLTGWEPTELANLSNQMNEAEARGDTYRLDLSDDAIAAEANPSAVRINTTTAAILSNLLVGRYSDLPISVVLPKSRSVNVQLARGGVFFALSNRSEVEWDAEAPEQWQVLAHAWAHPFHPSDATMLRGALVPTTTASRNSWMVRAAFQRYLLSVLHPHQRPAVSLSDDIQRIVRRWLSSRLKVTQGSELVSTLVDSAEIFYELVVNIADHAGLAATPGGASLGQLYATLGGGRESHNRLHFSVMDNGIGMPARVNERFVDTHRDASQALIDSVTGALPRRAGGRGVGLHRVWQIANRYSDEVGGQEPGGAASGSMRIISNGDGAGDAIDLIWTNGEAAPTTSAIPGVPVQGTIVTVSLSLEPRTKIEDEFDQLELEFTEPNSPLNA